MNRARKRKESDTPGRSDGFATGLGLAHSANPTNEAARMDQSFLAMPIDLFQQFRLSAGAKLEIVTTPDGFNKMDVISDSKVVATFTLPTQPTPIAPPQRLCAANEPTLNSVALRPDQWWDDDMLNEPLEPLAEFE